MRFFGKYEENKAIRFDVENTYTLYKSMLLYNPKWAAESILMRFLSAEMIENVKIQCGHSRYRAAYEIAIQFSVRLAIMFKSTFIISVYKFYSIFFLVCGQPDAKIFPVKTKFKIIIFSINSKCFFCDFQLLGDLCTRLNIYPVSLSPNTFHLMTAPTKLDRRTAKNYNNTAAKKKKNYSPNTLVLMRLCYTHTEPRTAQQNKICR